MTEVYLTFIHERFSKVASIVTKGGLGGLSPPFHLVDPWLDLGSKMICCRNKPSWLVKN